MDTGNSKTEINEALAEKSTEVNHELQSEASNLTVVNPNVQNNKIDIPTGTAIADDYIIEAPLSTNTGEANLYTCTKDGNTFVAKVYRRQAAIKSDIIIALEAIDSPYVAKLYKSGTWNGLPFEIIPYYKYGSLEGKTYPYDKLKDEVIPALNEGLHTLHTKDIIHKDLKPSNIMICDDQKKVAIIDFGISSIREGGSTVVVTKTGMTPEYSAPETFRGLYLEESDYYSLGITIYELFCGHTPYAGTDKEIIEQYISVQKIPFPKDFPPRLEELVTGLTYNDITNRKEKSNPNRRWTYEEVKSWCEGKDVPVPGGFVDVSTVTSLDIPVTTFQYKQYNRLDVFVEALGNDWGNGKKRLYRSLMKSYFQKFNEELATHCMDAEEAAQKDSNRSDDEYFALLYKLYPQLQSFHWVDYHYPSMVDLGYAVLKGLRSSDSRITEMLDTFIMHHLFSVREGIVNRTDVTRAKKVEAVEDKYLLAKKHQNNWEQMVQLYILGYYYSGAHDLVTGDGSFASIESLTTHVKQLLSEAPEKADILSSELIVMDNQNDSEDSLISAKPAPQFAGWLIALGKEAVLT